jgi:leucyl aminopeptidase
MEFRIAQKNTDSKYQLYIFDDEARIGASGLFSKEEMAWVTRCLGNDMTVVSVNRLTEMVLVYLIKPRKTDYQTNEACRKTGADLQGLLAKYKATGLLLHNMSSIAHAAIHVAEGMALADYQFLKYKTESGKKKSSIATLTFAKNSASLKDLKQLEVITTAVCKVRTLVNEPLNHLSAEQLAQSFVQMGDESGFKVTVFNKARIVKEKMGGLLAVNYGSQQPPTFSIMEYKPRKFLNKNPIVLVGKGVVYDTGGVSLKPTLNSMDRMKSDMSGAALVAGAMYAAARLELPLHLIALVPATDNRPGENAYVPGDVITMMSGKTVEVLNTDAEGRMILADALHWAKRYQPEILMDFATLTGAASVAVGEHGIVCMGNADDQQKKAFRDSGFRQYERLVEYPLWDEYGDQIKSDIADIKNVGGSSGGAITAGKFLEHFVDYPWMHFDIAGVSFATSKKAYTTIGGTGYGLRMLLDFLMHYGKN